MVGAMVGEEEDEIRSEPDWREEGKLILFRSLSARVLSMVLAGIARVCLSYILYCMHARVRNFLSTPPEYATENAFNSF